MTVAALLVALLIAYAIVVYEAREHRKVERELLDRLLNPEAATVAAFTRATPTPAAPPNTDAEDDRVFGKDITADLDLDWIPIGLDN